MRKPYLDLSSNPSSMVITTTCDCYHCTGIEPGPINTYEEDYAL
jgi:hypothetical protein